MTTGRINQVSVIVDHIFSSEPTSAFRAVQSRSLSHCVRTVAYCRIARNIFIAYFEETKFCKAWKTSAFEGSNFAVRYRVIELERPTIAQSALVVSGKPRSEHQRILIQEILKIDYPLNYGEPKINSSPYKNNNSVILAQQPSKVSKTLPTLGKPTANTARARIISRRKRTCCVAVVLLHAVTR